MRAFWAIAVGILMVWGCGGAERPPLDPPAEMRVITEGSGTATVIDGTGTTTSGWIGGSTQQTRVFGGADGQTYGGVWVDAPEGVVVSEERAPMALSLVIDTSGSMEGQKIAHARMAAASLIESLHDGDMVSIYAFSNSVSEIVSPTTIGAGTRSALGRSVGALNASGGTNMYDGIRVGESRLAEAPASHPIRRLVVISDGHANIGPSDPASLGQLAAHGTEWGAQVSAIGVGLDYDERTLSAMAVRSSGRLYHLEHPAQMAVILEQELELLANTIATNAWIEFVPADDVEILDVVSMGGRIENGRVRVDLGSLHAGQSREILMRARVPTSGTGTRSVGSARLVYQDPDAQDEHEQRVSLAYEVTDDRAGASASTAPRVHTMVATHEAAQRQLRAVELLNEGRGAAAARELEFAEEAVSGALQAAPADSRAAERLRRQRDSVRRGRNRARTVTSPAAGRSEALEQNDAAYEASGF